MYSQPVTRRACMHVLVSWNFTSRSRLLVIFLYNYKQAKSPALLLQIPRRKCLSANTMRSNSRAPQSFTWAANVIQPAKSTWKLSRCKAYLLYYLCARLYRLDHALSDLLHLDLSSICTSLQRIWRSCLCSHRAWLGLSIDDVEA